MFDDLFPDQRAASVGQLAQRPEPEPQRPGLFSGFGGALADSIPYAAVSGAGAWAQVLDAYGKAAAFRDAPAAAALAHKPAPDLQQLRADTIDQMGDSEDARQLRRVAKSYDPDPHAVGLAGQIVHGVASSLVKAGFYTLAGGPLAPALYGVDMGVTRAGELTDQGVDGGTATAAGLMSGAAGAVGLRLPAALGATRLQSAAIGAVVNPALNVAEVGGIHEILQHADYPQIAARYDPFDPVSLAVASITGAAFGAGFHGAKASAARPSDAPVLTPDGHAAALAMNEVRTHEADTLVNAHDPAALTQATDAQAEARAQMEAGDPVSVSERVRADAAQVEAVAKRLTDGPAAEAMRAVDQERVHSAATADTPVMLDAGQPLSSVENGTAAGFPDAAGAPGGTGNQVLDALVPAGTPAAGLVRRVIDAITGQEPQQPAQAAAPKADTPEQARAFELATRMPDAMIPTGELDIGGNPIHASAAEMIRQAENLDHQAQTEARAFQAAVNCALRFPR
ncbi:MAG: hypothetical protein KUL86_06965 [Castellaniella sp.]|nr:hypothetical protein [Castellaniella sp.]